MKTMRSLFAMLVALMLCVCAAYAAADDSLSGIYQGRIGSTPATLTLHVTNSVVAGRIKRAGATDIELNGTMSEGKIVGAASIGNANSFFEAYRKLGALVVVLEETGAVTGQNLVVSMHPKDRSVAFDTGASRYLAVSGNFWPLQSGANEVRFRASGSTTGATAGCRRAQPWCSSSPSGQ